MVHASPNFICTIFLFLHYADSPPGNIHKKHKKHKKKHKKKKEGDLEEHTAKPAITLKLKIGGETLGTKR